MEKLSALMNYFSFKSLACMCDENGSNNYTLCDVVTGQCDCKTKMITGRDCKKCEQSYYKFPDCKGKYICFMHTL